MIKTEDLVPGDRCIVSSEKSPFFGMKNAQAIFIGPSEHLLGGFFLFEGFGTKFVWDEEIVSIVVKIKRNT